MNFIVSCKFYGTLSYNLDFVNYNIIKWYIVVSHAATGSDSFDSLNNIHALCYPTEHRISPPLSAWASEVEEAIVCCVDEELARGRVRVVRPCHGNRSKEILETIYSFMLDRILRLFLIHARF